MWILWQLLIFYYILFQYIDISHISLVIYSKTHWKQSPTGNSHPWKQPPHGNSHPWKQPPPGNSLPCKQLPLGNSLPLQTASPGNSHPWKQPPPGNGHPPLGNSHPLKTATRSTVYVIHLTAYQCLMHCQVSEDNSSGPRQHSSTR